MAQAIENFNEKDYNVEFLKKTYNENFHNNHWNIFRPRNINASLIIYDVFKEIPKSFD
jgi:hypothetical protein